MMKEQLDDRTAAVEKMMRERRKLRDQRDRGAALTASLVLENAAYKKQVRLAALLELCALMSRAYDSNRRFFKHWSGKLQIYRNVRGFCVAFHMAVKSCCSSI